MSNPRPEGCARLEQMSERRTPALALLVLVQLVSSSVAETYEDRTTLRSAQGTCGSFPAIFSFGSSVADTGAGVLLRADSPAGSFPYGIDFPAPRSGRWSNGRLLVDLWGMRLHNPSFSATSRSVLRPEGHESLVFRRKTKLPKNIFWVLK